MQRAVYQGYLPNAHEGNGYCQAVSLQAMSVPNMWFQGSLEASSNWMSGQLETTSS
jgi:hypothetical protein